MSIITIMLFIVMPFLAVPIIFMGMIVDRKHNWIYGLLLAILLALIAYNFSPSETQDLYRYYVEMKTYYSNISFENYMQEMFSNTKILFKVLQLIIAQTQNYQLLPFTMTLVGYFISFYVILDFSNKYKINPIIAIFMILVFILTFYHINFISGLAQYLAISIGFLGFYLEYIKDKNKCIYKVLYILPVFIHASMIIIPLIRVLLKFDFKKTKKVYIISLIIYAFLPNIIYQLLNVLPGMETLAQKISIYTIQKKQILYTTYDTITLILLLFYTFIFYKSRKEIREYISTKYIDFVEIILLLNLFSIFYKDIFSRVFNITLLCMCIYLLMYFKKVKTEKIVIVIVLCLFSVGLGSVNVNNILANDFNNIFSNITENIFYYFK